MMDSKIIVLLCLGLLLTAGCLKSEEIVGEATTTTSLSAVEQAVKECELKDSKTSCIFELICDGVDAGNVEEVCNAVAPSEEQKNVCLKASGACKSHENALRVCSEDIACQINAAGIRALKDENFRDSLTLCDRMDNVEIMFNCYVIIGFVVEDKTGNGEEVCEILADNVVAEAEDYTRGQCTSFIER